MTVTALVTRNDITATASQTSLLSSGYTVNDVGNTSGGTVDISGGVTEGQVVSLVLAMPLDRTTNYQNSGDFLAADVNEDFDKIYIGAVQNNENSIDRSIRLQEVEPTVAMTLPLKADRSNKLLSFDSNGLPAAVTSSTALALIYSGTNTPENAVTATVGSLFLRTNGGAGSTLYVKESGSGNTGWVGK
jgi:hypothetical protein